MDKYIFRACSSSKVLSRVLGAAQLTSLQHGTLMWLSHWPFLRPLLLLLIMAGGYK